MDDNLFKSVFNVYLILLVISESLNQVNSLDYQNDQKATFILDKHGHRTQLLANDSRLYLVHSTAEANPPQFSQRDSYLAESFALNMIKLNGDWSKNGIQRIVRLRSESSHNYLTLRNYKIRANVPLDEAFHDPYTLIEEQIYRKYLFLKSAHTKKYICYNIHTGYFVMKDLSHIDKFCVFMLTTNDVNSLKFSIGSVSTDRAVDLSFNERGNSVNWVYASIYGTGRDRANSSLFTQHTKFTDLMGQVVQSSIFNSRNERPKLIVLTQSPTTTTTTSTTTTDIYFNNEIILRSSNFNLVRKRKAYKLRRRLRNQNLKRKRKTQLFSRYENPRI